MTTYNKYVAKLRITAMQLNTAVLGISQGAKVTTEEDIDVRIEAADEIIKYAQECKQSLLYFKNRLRNRYE